ASFPCILMTDQATLPAEPRIEFNASTTFAACSGLGAAFSNFSAISITAIDNPTTGGVNAFNAFPPSQNNGIIIQASTENAAMLPKILMAAALLMTDQAISAADPKIDDRFSATFAPVAGSIPPASKLSAMLITDPAKPTTAGVRAIRATAPKAAKPAIIQKAPLRSAPPRMLKAPIEPTTAPAMVAADTTIPATFMATVFANPASIPITLMTP